jgi:hypothetical protein
MPSKVYGIDLKISRITAFDHWLKMRHGNVLSLTKQD